MAAIVNSTWFIYYLAVVRVCVLVQRQLPLLRPPLPSGRKQISFTCRTPAGAGWRRQSPSQGSLRRRDSTLLIPDLASQGPLLAPGGRAAAAVRDLVRPSRSPGRTPERRRQQSSPGSQWRPHARLRGLLLACPRAVGSSELTLLACGHLLGSGCACHGRRGLRPRS